MPRFAPPAPVFAWEYLRSGAHYVSPRFAEFRPLFAPSALVAESPIVSALPFERSVLSWNGTAAGRLEMRVRVGDAWTPYLILAVLDGDKQRSATDLELAPILPASTNSIAASAPAPLATVNTDTLLVAKGKVANAFQIRATGPDLSGLRSLCVTSYRPVDRRFTTAPADGRAWGRSLEVPTRAQRDCEDPAIRPAVCSPTSLSMVLEYYRRPMRTIDVCREVFDATAGIYGNWPANTATAARLLGPRSWSAVVKMTGFDEVEREIAQNRPVVLSHRWNRGDLSNAPISRSLGHLIVCVGFTDTGDVVVNDPAAKSGEVRRVYKRAELFRTWQERGEGIAYVIRSA